jgi:hypothetical protein
MEVEEESFAYSALSGRWSVVITGLIALAGGAALLTAGRSTVLHVAPVGILALGTATVFFEFAVLGLPVMRRYGTNLTATRGAPKVWLAAHLDSKSQPLSMRMRILAVSLVVQSVVLVLILWLGAFLGAMAPLALWRVAGGFLAAGGLMLAFSTVGSESSGAVDDAAGVAAVLLAATRTREPVGLVLTSAEELGLAGARAWSSGREPATLINVDGIDDLGQMRCILHRGRDAALAAEVVTCAEIVGIPIRRGDLPIGALMDSVVFARSGWKAVALTRVSWRTLGIIHTRRDTPERCDGTGIAETAAVLSECVRRLA